MDPSLSDNTAHAEMPRQSSIQLLLLPPLISAVFVCDDAPSQKFERYWTIPRACKANQFYLMQRLAAREAATPERVDRHFKVLHFSEALEIAVRNDNLEMVKWLCNDLGTCVWSSGSSRILVRFDRGCKLKQNSNAIDLAVPSGNLDLIKWLHKESLGDCTSRAVDVAAERGDLHIVKWLRKNVSGAIFMNQHSSISTMEYAAMDGHLDVIQWLHEKQISGPTTNVIHFAARNGHLHVVEWFHANRNEGCPTKAMGDTAENGLLNGCNGWLPEKVICMSFNGCTRIVPEGCTADAMDKAAENGHLHVVMWLHENRDEGCTTGAMDNAAAGGFLDVVQWLHDNRTEGCTANAMDGAAMFNHLEVVKWLHEHRSEGCTTAAMDHAGSLAVVEWLHENHTEVYNHAAMNSGAHVDDLDRVLGQYRNRYERCSPRASRAALIHYLFNIFLWLCKNYADQVDLEATRD
ncbi:Ankyrin repeat-containing protein, partial [Globisporangium splendens]